MKTNVLKMKMLEHDVSTKQLAEMIDISYVPLTMRMNNKISFSVDDVKKIANVLELSNADIIEIFFE